MSSREIKKEIYKKACEQMLDPVRNAEGWQMWMSI